jgi:hypothetical protein
MTGLKQLTDAAASQQTAPNLRVDTPGGGGYSYRRNVKQGAKARWTDDEIC